MITFRFKPCDARKNVRWSSQHDQFVDKNNVTQGRAGSTNPTLQRKQLATRLKADRFRLTETTDDGWQVYLGPELLPRKETKPDPLAAFRAFCRPTLVRVAYKEPTFTEALGKSGITLHPGGCWCPRHNQPRAARKAAA